MSYSAVLSIVARIRPEAWDAIVPHTPAIRTRAGLERVALNPQPLPPREAFVVGAAELAHEIVRQALAIEAHGDSSFSFVSDTIDDWCGTPWPRKWPLPWPGPDPDPKPWWETVDVAAGRLVASVIFASVATRLADEKFSAVFADGAERLAAAAVDGPTGLTTKSAKRATGRRGR
jgi:hypothetical protein